ncbi:Ankyrin repeat-containing domain [Phytophthora cactorum]|nr:Ankyrin repeat-containing domain [Phytophthora cactorum]
MGGKRKWQEADWEVALAAQSYVAVLAAIEEEQAAPKSKTKVKKGQKKPTRRSTRARKGEEEKKEEDNDVTMETTVDNKQVDEFWLAQLQDDVTEDMLAQEDVSVHVTWLNRTAERRYEVAYDEQVDVGSILCHVYLRELSATALELTHKSLARAQRCLARTKAKLAGQEVPEDEDGQEEDNERPPPSLTTSRKRQSGEEDTKTSSGRGKGKTQKLSKREMAMHISPLRTTVDEAKYEDREMLGSQPFESFSGDVSSANREVVRAVLTRNIKLLKKLTTDADVYAELSTFDAPRSADISRTALHYAIDNDDLAAAALLRQTDEKVEKEKLATTPDVALPSHSTGQHTSRFSDYNRRAINASRGGKEGNNALLGDSYAARAATLSLDYLWRSAHASVEMLTLLYPTGDWTNGYSVGNNVCHLARCGNYRLVRKVVETLEKNGGWGFNELHHKVLADCPDDDAATPLLPAFRAVSAIKQAHQTRLRPLHLAAINPNTKYLEELWAVAGDEFSAIKDDQGFEPIHYAAGCESPEPMKFLLEKRCGLFGRTKTRLTPLMCALEAGREETALALLKFAATPGENGGGGQEVADKLVREKGPGGKQAIHFAARHGCAKVLEYLLTECGGAAEVNAVSGGSSKSTPLTFAAQNGHLDCVRVLLANGARVDLGDKLKKTPLILAVKNGHTRVAAALINGGANVNAYDSSENSVAHYAASYGWRSCLQLLCDVGAELWAQNAWGFVPLACALLKQRRACAELILAQVSGEAQQKFLDFRDRQGRTMLFLQCQHSHSLDQLSYLLDKGLNPNISDSEGEYPLQRLIQRACDEAPRTRGSNTSSSNQELSKFFLDAVSLLLRHGAQPQYELYRDDSKDDEKTPTKLQPLQLAMVGNQTEIFKLLLDQDGVHSDARSSDGSDAWMTAAALGAGLGDSFLSKLLEHHDKTVSGPLKLQGVQDPIIIRKCADKCPTTTEMMCEKDADGYTPSRAQRTVSNEPEDPDKLQHMRDVDSRLVELFAVYAEKSVNREALCVVKKLRVYEISQDDSDGNDSDDDESDDGGNAIPFNAPTPDSTTKVGKPKIMVQYETALHLIARRKLTSEPTNPWMKWYGCADHSVKCLMRLLLQKRPELFSTSITDKDKSLVNSVHLGSFKTALHYAVESGDAPTVQLLLMHQANANLSPRNITIIREAHPPCTGNCGVKTLLEPALFEAVESKHIKCARFLLKHGADVNCVSKTTQETPLHVALRANDGAAVGALLSHGASLMARDAFGASPLHLAVVARHSIPAKEAHEEKSPASNPVEPAILVALKDTSAPQAVIVGDTKNRSPVHYAARNRDLELLQALLRAAGKDGAHGAVNQRDWLGRTPLHYASGADVTIQDDFGFSALHFALIKVQLDWQEKYDATHKKTQGQKDREGQIHDAKVYETEKREAFLRDHLGVIPGGETDPVETVSNLATERGIMAQDHLGAHRCILQRPQEQKDAMALQDRDGFTPLGLAVLHKRQTTIMTLLRSGSARQTISTKPKKEPKIKIRSYFYHAVSNGLTGICHMLLSAKFCRRQAIEDSRPNSRGETLLHSLAKTRLTGFDALAKKLAWALVDAGIRVDAQDNKGNIAMHYASKCGNTHLMDFLHHQSGGTKSENIKNHQKRNGRNLSDDQLLTVSCYFLEHPSYSLDIHAADHSGMNVLESGRVKPVLFFMMLETLLKRGVDLNLSFHSAHAAHWSEERDLEDGKDQLLRSGRELCEVTSLAKGDEDKMPALYRPEGCLHVHRVDPCVLSSRSRGECEAALAQRNTAGLTACHMAVQPLDYGSYENTRLLGMLVRAGGDLRAKDSSGKSAIDYARDQRSRFVLRFLERTFPEFVAYLAECETSGKISRSLVATKVNASCDVGDGKGTELDALLTKVDVKNGRFGLNVFYRLQLVRDELQDIYVLFTNWGRIGETGKFQNTPFRDETEAVNEFKKIFRSKTGNPWESQAEEYNLVQRVNHSTKVDDEVTRSFREDMESEASKGVVFPEPRDPDLVTSPSVMAMLAAITDVRNLQLAAQTSCGFAGGDLPLAKQDELRDALEKLTEIRGLLEEKEEL